MISLGFALSMYMMKRGVYLAIKLDELLISATFVSNFVCSYFCFCVFVFAYL